MEETQIVSPEEINEILRFIAVYLSLFLGTSVGTYTKYMLFPSDNKFKQWVGLAALSSFVALRICLHLGDTLSLAGTFLMCVSVGFTVPSLKSWFKGRKLLKIALRAFVKTNDLTSNLLDEVGDELEKEEDNDN